MLQTFFIDSKTMIIKANNADDLLDISDFVLKKGKQKDIVSFLDFAAKNRIIDKIYRFSREKCHER
ncbi:MAG: hypothetical protein LBV16_07685 [Elusimicrobiota bacterium]|jgi:hypothetical protein|nr:hypothetical protein [Elusimicrobiota bacterium]